VIFVDTGAWYARYVDEDVDHQAAVTWFSSSPDRILTTDYIVDELLTLLKTRGYATIAFSVGERLLAGQACQLEYGCHTTLRRRGRFFRSIATKAGASPIAQASQ
jgi:uncharacterized protein